MKSYRDEDKIAQWMNNNSITIVEPTIGNYGGIALIPISITPNDIPKDLYLKWGGEVVPGARKHMYIQFKEKYPTQEQRILLGNFSIPILDPIGGYGTWIASMPASMNPADIPAEAGLRWMGDIPVGDKWISDNPEVPDRARLESGLVIVYVTFYDDVTLKDARKLLHKYVNNSSKYTPYRPVNESDFNGGYEFATEEHNIDLIVNEDIVSRIGYPAPPPKPEDNESQSVPGFGALCSMNAFILLYFMRYRI